MNVLHQVVFTILNGFVNSQFFDSKDRHLIKLFLDHCSSIFRQILRLRQDARVGFLLTLFEAAFAVKTPKDVYDIYLMHKLFG